jgi:hypothetical protein
VPGTGRVPNFGRQQAIKVVHFGKMAHSRKTTRDARVLPEEDDDPRAQVVPERTQLLRLLHEQHVGSLVVGRRQGDDALVPCRLSRMGHLSEMYDFSRLLATEVRDTSGARHRDDFVTHLSRVFDARPKLRDSQLGRRVEARQNAHRIDEGMRLGKAD